MTKDFGRFAWSAVLVAALGCASPPTPITPIAPGGPVASGTVYEDRNANGRRDPGEPGLSKVRVSNGRDITTTDRVGRWVLPVDSDTALFVIKPTGMRTAIDDRNLPRFYYLHKRVGSPVDTTFPGVPATGNLPQSIDFPLYPQAEPTPFRVLIVGDPQPRNMREVDFFARDIVAELPGHRANFGIVLGDVVDHDLSLYDSVTLAMSLVGVPWYHVLGNHDLNLDATSDKTSDETFERVFGPSTYAFEYGDVHFLVLDDIDFRPADPSAGTDAGYRGGLTEQQLTFIGNYVAGVPRDERIVLLMHIPLVGGDGHQVPQRDELLRLLSEHEFTQSVAAHLHTQAHFFLGSKEGNSGPAHHHWVSPTASGSWWRGRLDEAGLPHATMRDGSPNGYSIMTFDGQDVSVRFQAARRPAHDQLRIHAPNDVTQDSAFTVFANVYAGSERSRVELRIASSESSRDDGFTSMQRSIERDPAYMQMRAHEESTRTEGEPALPFPDASLHLWKQTIDAAPAPGSYWLEVRSVDMYGQHHFGRRPLRVLPAQVTGAPR